MDMEPPRLPDRDEKVVCVKTEPPDLDDTPNEDQSFFQSKENSIFENVLVKVELMSYHSDNEEIGENVEKILPDDPNDDDFDQLQKPPVQDEFMKVEIKQEFDSDDDNSDEDYKPTSKPAKKKLSASTPRTPAERMRAYREKIKQDPERFAEFKRKHANRMRNKIRKISDLTEKEKEMKRKKWRDEKRKRKEIKTTQLENSV